MAELSSAHLLGIVLVISVVSFLGNQNGIANTDAQETRGQPKVSRFAAPTLKFLYCTNPFVWFGMDTPPLFTYALENKLYACLMLFFVMNAIEGQLVSTGAFEISLNDEQVWSKLETGRIPQPNEIIQIIDNHINPGGGGFNPDF